ncbi:hypothetical protein F2Q68_00033736 [Brassica cretica]|uniref:Uncharacterized protein n=1 Tax=Brassica cretica TaxID=69181 RepID=A0A8S9H478_BRACR|nr:hypothetical protein F2Q68_00033736 [Brassica cretica]
MRIQTRTQRRTLLRPCRSLRSEWRAGTSRVRAWSLRSNRAVFVLGRYVATELCACLVTTLVRARSLRSDRAWLELDRYVATELCNQFAALPFSVINLRVFCGFWENKFNLPKSFRKTCFEKSQARLVALPVGEKSWLGRYVASEGLTGRYVASGSKPRRVLLVFVVKSQRKLRLRRNEKRFDEDSKENLKEDLSEA